MKDRGSVSEALDTLRPDAFIEDAYRRHRSGDLARAFQTRRTPRRARRFSAFRHSPFILVAGGAVAGLAAAALVVPFLGGGGAGTGSPDLDASAGPSVSAGKPQSTRTILLAAAESAAKAPADSGRFWFSRVRTAQLMRADPTKRVK
uniref:hypothetical protein n=1 Tax=Nonomuraea lactucae TaxID=2249762 RepID=UPI00196673D2